MLTIHGHGLHDDTVDLLDELDLPLVPHIWTVDFGDALAAEPGAVALYGELAVGEVAVGRSLRIAHNGPMLLAVHGMPGDELPAGNKPSSSMIWEAAMLLAVDAVLDVATPPARQWLGHLVRGQGEVRRNPARGVPHVAQ